MVTTAVPGLLTLARALGFESATVKVRFPEKGIALLIATVNVLAAVSPSAHFRVPLVAVKSVPATAVQLAVLYATLAAPLEPPVRLTLTGNAAALCATA